MRGCNRMKGDVTCTCRVQKNTSSRTWLRNPEVVYSLDCLSDLSTRQAQIVGKNGDYAVQRPHFKFLMYASMFVCVICVWKEI